MKFFLLVDPPTVTAQQRKVVVNKRKPRFYEPEKLKEAKELFIKHLKPFKPKLPLKGPIELKVTWFFPIKGKHKSNEYRITKPDTDNLQKLLKDCMTEVGFWEDDAQVCVEHVEKVWSEEPCGLDIAVLPTKKYRPVPEDENKNGNRLWRGLSNVGNGTCDEERAEYTQEGCERLAAAIVEDAVNCYREAGFKIKELDLKLKLGKISKKARDEQVKDCRSEMKADIGFFNSQTFANICQIDKDWLIETLDDQIAHYDPSTKVKGGAKHGRI